ncbi:ExeA family protein [Roseibium aggregatum]|uniref:AAA family ATPase n=1 Tax=Roseibium aggregatum TaxID=187304 RepID=A0A939IZB7_9HYPH|nr:AAA family ATPase [Roseibium aggregatum]MBN9669881.1 AAA family ATPase [Roseibium aggregatum]
MAFAMLEYGIVNHAGFTVITGEVGAGKTTLIQHLLSKLPGDVAVGLLANTGGGGDLLEWVLMAFDQDFESGSHVALYKRFKDFLLEQHSLGRRTVLIVDEAQNLGAETLEELRMLSNLNTHERELLQIVLSGQPELKTLLAAPSLRQFVQRVSSDFHLSFLDQQEVKGYIEHRLEVAGATRPLFTSGACDLVFYATQGTPRLINTLCDTALLYGFATESDEITVEIVKRVLDDKRRFGVFPIHPGPQYDYSK